jgi:hypothetical protein
VDRRDEVGILEGVELVGGLVNVEGTVRSNRLFFFTVRGFISANFTPVLCTDPPFERPTETERRRKCLNTGSLDSVTGDVGLVGELWPRVTVAFFVGDADGVLVMDSAINEKSSGRRVLHASLSSTLTFIVLDSSRSASFIMDDTDAEPLVLVLSFSRSSLTTGMFAAKLDE